MSAPRTAYPPTASLFTSTVIAPALDETVAPADDFGVLPVIVALVVEEVTGDAPVVVALAPPLLGKFVGAVTLIPRRPQISTDIDTNATFHQVSFTSPSIANKDVELE